jgi:hypothetical protein
MYMATPIAGVKSSQVSFISQFSQLLPRVLMHCSPNCPIRIEVLADRSIRGRWTSDLLSYAANNPTSLELLPNSPVFVEGRCAGAYRLLAG